MPKMQVTMKGQPLALAGGVPEVGDKAPDFEVVASDLSPVRLSDYAGKVRIISSVPSLDTPVCDLQTRKFAEQAAALGENVVLLTISMDLPFAQKRWCAAAGIDGVAALSDHRNADFGRAFGVLIPQYRLLARAVFVVDGQGVIRYKQVVEELTNEPDYAAAIQAAEGATV